jgi:hypothetical protein
MLLLFSTFNCPTNNAPDTTNSPRNLVVYFPIGHNSRYTDMLLTALQFPPDKTCFVSRRTVSCRRDKYKLFYSLPHCTWPPLLLLYWSTLFDLKCHYRRNQGSVLTKLRAGRPKNLISIFWRRKIFPCSPKLQTGFTPKKTAAMYSGTCDNIIRLEHSDT